MPVIVTGRWVGGMPCSSPRCVPWEDQRTTTLSSAAKRSSMRTRMSGNAVHAAPIPSFTRRPTARERHAALGNDRIGGEEVIQDVEGPLIPHIVDETADHRYVVCCHEIPSCSERALALRLSGATLKDTGRKT